MAGEAIWGNPRKSIKYMQLQGAPKVKEEQIRYGRNPYFTQDYYDNASKALGITPEQARIASIVGGRTQSGKARDDQLRFFQDLNDGGNRRDQYAQNRKIAKGNKYSFAKVASLKANPPTPEKAVVMLRIP